MQCFFSSHKWESSDDARFFSLRHIMIIIISMDVSLQLKLFDTLLMFTIYKSISEWETFRAFIVNMNIIYNYYGKVWTRLIERYVINANNHLQ